MPRAPTAGERPARDAAAALYGVILATALTAAYSEYSGTDAGEIALAVVVTGIVFWLAHAYAAVVARGLVRESRFSWRGVGLALGEEVPLLVGTAPPVLALLLAPIGILSEYHAENVAIATGVGTLAIVGFVAGHRQQAGAGRTLVMTIVSLAMGLAIVALKAIVH